MLWRCILVVAIREVCGLQPYVIINGQVSTALTINNVVVSGNGGDFTFNGYNTSIDIAPSALGNFGVGDYTVGFTWCGLGSGNAYDSIYGSSFFQRSNDTSSSYIGPSAFLYQVQGGLLYRSRATRADTCQYNLTLLSQTTCRPLLFERKNNVLSIWVDNVQICTGLNSGLNAITDSSVVYTRMRFGANYANTGSQNIYGKMRNITLTYPAGCLAGLPTMNAQYYSPEMSGCGGKVSYGNRAALCAAGYSPCSALQYKNYFQGLAPQNHYWLDDSLTLWPGNTNVCYVTDVASGFPCPLTVTYQSQNDSFMNQQIASQNNCGLFDAQNAFMSSCGSNPQTAGTLCCSCGEPSISDFNVVSGPCWTSDNCVHSPNHPQNYTNNQQCSITVNSPGELNVVSFATESNYDFLTVDGTQYSGSIGPNGVDVSMNSVISWASDASNVNYGWRMCLSQSLPDRIYAFSIVNGTGCTLSSLSCATSLNYPNNYGNFQNCTLVPNYPGYLTVNAMNTEAGYDALTIDGVKYSGTVGPINVHVSPVRPISWSSDVSNVNTGWEVCLNRGAIQSTWSTLGPCKVTGNCIASPNYPSMYDVSQACIFQNYRAGSINFISFDMGSGDTLNKDSVNYINSNYQSLQGTVLTPMSKITWTSDSAYVATGFKICLLPVRWSPSSGLITYTSSPHISGSTSNLTCGSYQSGQCSSTCSTGKWSPTNCNCNPVGCAAMPQQVIQTSTVPEVVGCGGSVSFANRADLCGYGYAPCSVAQYLSVWTSSFVPSYNYWTNDYLNFSGGGSGSCVTTLNPSGSCGAGPMRVCTSTSTDAFGNPCATTQCGFNAYANRNLGGCSADSAGTMCCRVHCPVFGLQSGSVVFSDPGNNNPYGSTATVSCPVNTAWSLGVDYLSFTCTISSMWDKPIGSCGCPTIDLPNGIVNYSSTRRAVGTNASFSCAANFQFVGSSSAICNANGQWSVYGSCGCLNLGTIANGVVSYSDSLTYAVGSTANVTCAAYYAPNAAQLQCLSGSGWNSSPICSDINECLNVSACRGASLCRNRVGARQVCTPFFFNSTLRLAPSGLPATEVFLPVSGASMKVSFSWADYAPLPANSTISVGLTYVSSMDVWQQYSDAVAACVSPATYPGKFSWTSGVSNYNNFGTCAPSISAGGVPAVTAATNVSFLGAPGALDVQFTVPSGLGKGFTVLLRQLSDVWSVRNFGVVNRSAYLIQQATTDLTSCKNMCVGNSLCLAVEWSSDNFCALLSNSPEFSAVATTASAQTHYARAWFLLASSSDKVSYFLPVINNLSLATNHVSAGSSPISPGSNDAQITFTGANFAPTNPAFSVWLSLLNAGAPNPTSSAFTLACPLDSRSTFNTTICTFPQNLFGRYTPFIQVLNSYVWGDVIFQVVQVAQLVSVDPPINGGFQCSGGDTLTVRGFGFTTFSTVTVDGQACLVKSWSVNASNATTLTCTTPAGTGLKKAVVVREANFYTLPIYGVDYFSPVILTISSPSCDAFLQNCVRTGGNLTLTATNLLGSESMLYVPTVTIGTQACVVNYVSMTNRAQGRNQDTVTCVFPAGYASFNQITVAQFNGASAALSTSLGYAPCDVGTFDLSSGPSVVTACASCAAGKFQDRQAQTRCMDCPFGAFSSANKSSVCTPCAAGTYQNQTGQIACIACALGTRTPEMGRPVCDLCPVGRYSNQTSSSTCDACDLGRFAGMDGLSDCVDCDPGWFGPQTQLPACLMCNRGSFSNSAASIQCALCAPGSYQPSENATTCLPCEVGRAQGVPGQSDCMDCSAGMFTGLNGSFTCFTCQPGTYSNQSGANDCDSCDLGRFSPPNSVPSACTDCEPGNYCNKTGCTGCTKCASGYHQSERGQPFCEACAIGNFSSTEGAPDCTECKPGTFTNQTAQGVCLECGLGEYQDASGQQNCSSCVPGFFGSMKASPVCVMCDPGSYTNLPKQSACANCPAGEYQDQPGQPNCTSCPSGKISNQNGLLNCTECNPGSYAEYSNLSACTLCPEGRAQNSSGQSSCLECAPGEVASVAGYRFCVKCEGTNFAAQTNQSCAICPQFSSISSDGNSCICQAGYYAVPFQLAVDNPTVTKLTNAADSNRGSKTDALTLGFFCMECPVGANCYAEATTISTVKAQAGWSRDRENLNLTFFQCPILSSCSPQGCSGGYAGSLCKACEPGYGSASGGVCTACLDRSWELGRLSLIIIAVISLLALFVYQTRRSARQDSSSFMIAAKILVSGMQFNALALSMNFKFVTTVSNLLNTQSTVSQLGLQSIFSSDCALESPDYNPVLVSSGLFLFSPLLVFLCTLPFAALAAAYTHRRRARELDAVAEMPADSTQVGAQDYHFMSLFKNYAITGTVIIVFIIHPMLTKKAFELFNCVQIGVHPEETYLYADLSIQCYAYPHIIWVLLLGLPLLIVMVGEPLVFASFLHKHKAQLTQETYKLTYSFLYKGYQPALWSVWEVSIMARKAIIVAIAVFGNKSTRIQALLAVALCFVVLGFHQTYKPFLDPWLNRLELLSIVTSATLYFFAQFLLQTTSDVTGQGEDLAQTMIVLFQCLFLICALVFIFYGVFHKVKNGVLQRRVTKQRKALELEMGDLNGMPLAETDSSSVLPEGAENPKTFVRQESTLKNQPTAKEEELNYYDTEKSKKEIDAMYAPYEANSAADVVLAPYNAAPPAAGGMYVPYSKDPPGDIAAQKHMLEVPNMPMYVSEEVSKASV